LPVPFLPRGNDLNNREIAIVLLIGALVVFVLARDDTRGPAIRVIRALAQRLILLSLAGLLAWVVLVTLIGSRLGLWTPDLIKDTTIWFVTFAVVRLFRMANIGKDRHPFREVILDPLAATALVEFITNVYVFPLLVEILLVPFVTLLGLLVVVAGYQKTPYAKGIASGVLGILGIGILGFSAFELVHNWSSLDLAHQIRLLVLPIWLTVGTVPYLYVMSLLAGYEAAFLRIAFASPNRRITWRSRLAMFTVLNVRTRAVANLRASWIGRLAEAETLAQARTVLVDYLRHADDVPRSPDM
jgi:hypothetical protein